MKIEQLLIRDFRNLSAVEIEPAPQLNVFTGSNAQGKTNLLEAIQVLSTGTSFRRANDRDLLCYLADLYRVSARYALEQRQLEATLQYRPENGKVLTINKKRVNWSHPDRIKVVSFTPDDLLLVKGAPERRRNFLDGLLKQISTEYAFRWENFNKTLKKRNFLFKLEKIDKKKQAAIDEVFLENGSYLVLKRIQLINYINDYLQSFFNVETGEVEQLKLKYAVSMRVERDKLDLSSLQEAFRENMELRKEEEWRRGRSLLGPHLDDFNIYLGERNAAFYASQGQQRNIVVSLKWSELYSIHRISGNYPIFLLDEVLAELDHGKQEELLRRLSQAPFQSFMSSVNIDRIQDSLPGRTWQVVQGKLEQRGE